MQFPDRKTNEAERLRDEFVRLVVMSSLQRYEREGSKLKEKWVVEWCLLDEGGAQLMIRNGREPAMSLGGRWRRSLATNGVVLPDVDGRLGSTHGKQSGR